MKSVTSKTVPPLSIECNDPLAIKLRNQIEDIEKEMEKLKHL